MLAAVGYLVFRVVSSGREGVPHGVEQGPAGLSSSSGEEEQAAREGPEPGESVLTSIAGAFTDQDGHTRALAEFRGVPFVASAIYTRCPNVCPRTVAELQRPERALPGRDAPSFVPFHVDPALAT